MKLWQIFRQYISKCRCYIGGCYAAKDTRSTGDKENTGLFLVIDGNNKTQVKYMRRVAEQWCEKVRVGHLARFDNWTAFNTSVMKTLEYLC